MEQFSNNNFSQPAPTAPPPPAEVKVRTMHSDLASMAKSGGGVPHFENIKVEGLNAAKDAPASQAKQRSSAVLTLVVIVSLAALGLIAYVAYQMLFVGK